MDKNVLFLHSTASFGGASKSLSELCKILKDSFNISIVTPSGNAVEFFESSGITVYTSPVSQFNHTEYGSYRGIRWLVLLRELLFLPMSYYRLSKVLRENSFDLIHLNEVTLLPWALYFKAKKIPVVVHVRSVYQPFKNSFRDKFFAKILESKVDQILAIDDTVAKSLPALTKNKVKIIHNGLVFRSGLPNAKIFSFKEGSQLNVCIVGSLLRLKGLYEFIEAANLLISKKLNITFHVAGSNPREHKWISSLYKKLGMFDDVESDLKEYVVKNSLGDRVVFHGLVKDISSFYSDMDVVCFPSYYNAPGRPVFEAAYYGIPSIVAVDRPTADTIVHNETGLVIENPSSQLLAMQLERLYHDREFLAKLGAGARKLAEDNYSLEKNALAVKKIYEEIMANKVI